MAEVILRQLDEAVIEEHGRRARARGIPLEQQLREVLSDAVRQSCAKASERAEALARADALRARTRPGSFPTAVELVREERDAR